MIRTLIVAAMLIGTPTLVLADHDHDHDTRDYGHQAMKMASPYDVPTTLTRLQAAIEKRGAGVFAVIDHAEGAASIDADLRPTTLVIFGNPKLGTPILQANQKAGLDLPLRVLVYQDEAGDTLLMANKPAFFIETYRIPADHVALDQMDKALWGILTEVVSK